MAAYDAVAVKAGLTVEGDTVRETPVALLRGRDDQGSGFALRLDREELATILAKLTEQENEAKAIVTEA